MNLLGVACVLGLLGCSALERDGGTDPMPARAESMRPPAEDPTAPPLAPSACLCEPPSCSDLACDGETLVVGSVASAPAERRDSSFDLELGWSTVLVHPHGDLIAAKLPLTKDVLGRRYTVKLIGDGAVELHGTLDLATMATEKIDDSATLSLVGPPLGPQPALTLEATPYGWRAVSAYP